MWYKVLDETAQSIHGGTARWFTPQEGRPGAWMPKIERIIMCVSGYHLVDESAIIHWIGPSIWEAEHRGWFMGPDEGKIVAQEARLVTKIEGWHRRAFMSFTVDCMDHVGEELRERYVPSVYELVVIAKEIVRDRADNVYVDPGRVASLNQAVYTTGPLVSARLVILRLINAYGNENWWKQLEWVVSLCRRGSESELHWQSDRLMNYIEGRA